MRQLSRRTLLRTAGAGIAAALAPTPVLSAQAPRGTSGEGQFHGLRVGVASYSLRKFSYARVLADMQLFQVHFMSLKSFHLPLASTSAQIREARQRASDIGVTIASCGVIYLKDDDASMLQVLDYGQHLGVETVVVGMSAAMLPRLDRLIRNYDLRVGIHNHGPEDPHFPTPTSVYQAVRPFDRRIGLCMDIGHTFRTGQNVVQDLHLTRDRLYSLHFKDLSSRVHDDGVPVGTGLMPEISILKTLLAIGFRGDVELEYEAQPTHPVPGMMESFGFMRGVLQTLA